MRLLRLFHTIRYLRPVQFYGRAWFRLYRVRPDERPAPRMRDPVAAFVPPARRESSMVRPGCFRFLGQEGELREAGDWNDPDRPKLWLYNLHYFDDLNARDGEARRSWHEPLIRRWVAENPPTGGNGWDPYPTSLRVVNWIKWSWRGNRLEQDALDSLAVQVRWLRHRLEFHLLGNHLFANAKALVLAGLFFEGGEANEWLEKGRRLLEREIPEQILPDGGHFERSPMYHLILLEDMLDLINASRAYGQEAPALWLDAARRMLDWAQVMRHPDGEVPFFNDAAIGIAPAPAEIDSYARRLELTVDTTVADVSALPDSGYVRMARGRGRGVVFVDAAPVGPDYLPGHAHADSLSFELSLGGRRLCVNSGTSTYEKGALRQWQRSTAAHNTVRLGGEDSSEVWAGFRVARRARAWLEWADEGASQCMVAASHDGYRRLPGSPVHRRAWCLSDRSLTVEDELAGRGEHSAESFLHFHPDWQLAWDEESASVVVRDASGNYTARLRFLGEGALTVATGEWYPGFGVVRPNQYCHWRASSRRLPMTFGFEITWPE